MPFKAEQQHAQGKNIAAMVRNRNISSGVDLQVHVLNSASCEVRKYGFLAQAKKLLRGQSLSSMLGRELGTTCTSPVRKGAFSAMQGVSMACALDQTCKHVPLSELTQNIEQSHAGAPQPTGGW